MAPLNNQSLASKTQIVPEKLRVKASAIDRPVLSARTLKNLQHWRALSYFEAANVTPRTTTFH
jgi:hypothetical protein